MACSPTLDRTVALFRSQIQSGNLGSSGILPTTKALASYAGVSLVTAWKAIQELKREGLIVGGCGRPLTIRHCSLREDVRPVVLPPQPKLKWLHLAMAMRRDVLAGAYRPGQVLPTVKELMNKYGVSYPTLRKTLALLMEESLIVLQAPGYRVASLGPARDSRNRIALITNNDTLGGIYSAHFLAELLRRIEGNCRTAQVALDILVHRQVGEAIEYMRWPDNTPVNLLSERHQPLGVIFSPTPQSHGDERQKVAEELMSLRIPVAVFDAVGEWEYPRGLAGRPRIRIFRMGVTDFPGRAVGRFLLGLGHRCVAYLSPFHAFEYSRTRLRGLTDSFRQAGLDNGVLPFVSSTLPVENSGVVDCAREAVALSRACEKWMRVASTAYRREFEPVIKRILTIHGDRASLRATMDPLFDQALSDTRITAWVAANDIIAFFAQDYCRDRGVEIPRDLSLVGFDDQIDAVSNNLTSYNHNVMAIADAMIAHLFQRPSPLALATSAIVDIEGAIAVRGSTAPRRQQSQAPQPQLIRPVTLDRASDGSPPDSIEPKNS